MAKLKVRVALAGLNVTPPNKVKKGKKIIVGITTNATKLPHLPIAVLVLTDRNNNLDDCIQEATSGDHAAVAAMNTSEKLWLSDFKENGNYIDIVANGNKALILSTGYDATPEESVAKLPVVGLTNFRAVPFPTGTSVALESDVQHNAAGYFFTIVPKNTLVQQVGNMIHITIGTTTIYITMDTHYHTTALGLPPVELLSVYGAAFNLKGVGPITKTGNDISVQQ